MDCPKFFICENLLLPNSSFVIHIYYPKFMIELPKEKIIWLEDNLDELTKLEFKDILNESIDWALEEIKNINKLNSEILAENELKFKNNFIKKFN